MSSDEPPTNDRRLLSPVENHLLKLAVETEWALYEAIWSLRGEYPDSSEADLVALARPAMHRLVRDGLIEMYWHSSRETQSVTGPISVPVDTPMTQAQIQDALVDDARWRPPDGTHGRPWVETPHVYFVATGEGEQAHREWRSVY